MKLRQFLAHINIGHKDAGGRWGNPQQTRLFKPRTVKDYHSCLRSLFNWIVAEGGLEVSPLVPASGIWASTEATEVDSGCTPVL